MSYQEKQELLRKNPVFAAFFFHYRWNSLLRNVILVKNGPLGKVRDYWSRIEFQKRGSPHVHALLWIENAPDLDTHAGQRSAASFIDKYIKTVIPLAEDDEELRDFVLKYQIHKHTQTCQKRNTLCRFHFPKPVSEETHLKMNMDPAHATNFYETKRSENDIWVNAYNPEILKIFQSNMDIQLIGSKYGAAAYICAYISKAEPMNLKEEIAKSLNAMSSAETISRKLFKLGNVLLTHREMSAQEATYIVCSIPLVQSSSSVVFVNTLPFEKRTKLLKSHQELENLDDTSEEIFLPNITDYYQSRPSIPSYNDMCLAQFVTEYIVTAEEPRPNSNQRTRYKLLNLDRWIYKRTKPVCLKTPSSKFQQTLEDKSFQTLFLYLPWRKESELICPYLSATEALKQKHGLLHSSSLHLQQFTEDVRRLVQQLQLLDNLYGVTFNAAAPNTTMHHGDLCEDPANHFVSLNPLLANQLEQTNTPVEHDNVPALPYLTMTDDQFKTSLESLGQDQQEVLQLLHEHYSNQIANSGIVTNPLHLFITGGAGTGKSYLIKLIREYLNRLSNKNVPVVMLLAYTGLAAANISGSTIHSALSIPVDKNLVTNYSCLSSTKLQQLRDTYKHIHTIIIDEVSMVSSHLFTVIHKRLTEIKDTADDHQKTFGGLSILCVGDMLQLKPVCGSYIFQQTSMIPFDLWKTLFKVKFLTQNFRQSEDSVYASLLNRARVGIITDEDIKLLNGRQKVNLQHEEWQSAVHLYPTRKQCEKYNENQLQKITDSTNHVFKISSKDLFQVNGNTDNLSNNVPSHLLPKDDRQCGGLPTVLSLAVGSRVMLIRNIMSSEYLVNGATGIVTAFKLKNVELQQPGSENPSEIMVKFDDPKVGAIFQSSMEHQSIAISTISSHFTLKTGQIVLRTQFPLIPSWAVTIHKAQGMTLERVVLDIGKKYSNRGWRMLAYRVLKNCQDWPW
ncbi:uncharacterized protein LOC134238944 [Saccostrea cucullata]|uniref:uncharacterized protein LOC134238944 n=1 Tax=Saccostrea cuccullata TaxID=36930 RepID=UPI002ED61944